MFYNAVSQAEEVYTRAEERVFGDLTVAEFDAVHDAIDNVEEVGRAAKSIEIEGVREDRDSVISTLLAVVETRSGDRNAALQRRLKAVGAGALSPLSFAAAMRRVEVFALDMDGGMEGVYARYIVQPVRDAFDLYQKEKAAHLRALRAIIEPRKAEFFGPAISAPELGYIFENKGQLFHALLHMGNGSNRKKLLAGRGWEAGWDGFLLRMWKEGTVTKADHDAAQAIWDVMDGLKRPAQEAHRKICGFSFRPVLPAAIRTPFGTYEGGFIPAVFEVSTDMLDKGSMKQGSQQGENPASMLPARWPAFPGLPAGDDARSIALDILMLPAHVDRLLRFIHLEPVVQPLAQMIGRPEIRFALDEMAPGIFETVIGPWLSIARQPVSSGLPGTPEGQALLGTLKRIRGEPGVRNMVLDMVNATALATGGFSTLRQIAPERLKAALIRFMCQGEGAAMREEAVRLSPIMKARIGAGSREVETLLADAVVKPEKGGLLQQKAAVYGDILKSGARAVLDVVVWHSAYDEAIANGVVQADALMKADSLVQEIAGTETSAEGETFMPLFALFYSYFNGQASLAGGNLQPIMGHFGYAGAPRLFAVYMAGIATPAIIAQVLVATASAGDSERDGDLDALMGLFLGAKAEYGAGMTSQPGQLFDAFEAGWDDVPSSSDMTARAGLDLTAGLSALGLVLDVSEDWLAKAAAVGPVAVNGEPQREVFL
ncbi:hypothetical protein [uncultured Agrobacterium sp.]|uniref:hypothetical protein n=1 Tax=uncultured Agrobacterium sp. TaxID=157277 RepID=UPI0025DD5422|nr:hypothetical protein [uncultured Agrobacterium sp.]